MAQRVIRWWGPKGGKGKSFSSGMELIGRSKKEATKLKKEKGWVLPEARRKKNSYEVWERKHQTFRCSIEKKRVKSGEEFAGGKTATGLNGVHRGRKEPQKRGERASSTKKRGKDIDHYVVVKERGGEGGTSPVRKGGRREKLGGEKHVFPKRRLSSLPGEMVGGGEGGGTKTEGMGRGGCFWKLKWNEAV